MSGYIDYSKHFPKALAAQGQGRKFLVITPLVEPFYLGRELVHYEVQARKLLHNCEDEGDFAWANFTEIHLRYGDDFTFKSLLDEAANGGCVFDVIGVSGS